MEKCILKDQNPNQKLQVQQHYLSVEKIWIFFTDMDEALQNIVHRFAF